MNIPVKFTFQNVNALKLDDFFGTDKASFNNSTIKVGSKTYNVTFADDGKVSVSFATKSFFHIFQKSAKTAVCAKIQELVDLYSLKRDVAEGCRATAIAENTVKLLDEEINPNLKADPGSNSKTFAHYGFSDVRQESLKAINEESLKRLADNKSAVNAILINDLNETVGLPGDSHAANGVAFMKLNNTVGISEFGSKSYISPELSREWAAFLKGHDVDIFSKIQKASDEAKGEKVTGWAGEIKKNGLENAVADMVRKNLDPRVVVKYKDINAMIMPVAKALIELSKTGFGEIPDMKSTTVSAIGQKMKDVLSKYVAADRLEEAFDVLDNAATGAFWRQTSKLGLDFFKSRGTPVIFDWTKFNGEATDGSELDDKWWKNANADVYQHFGVAITNSEMRHLQSQKYKDATGDSTVFKIQGTQTKEEVMARVEQDVNALVNLPAGELKKTNRSLMKKFEGRVASDFHKQVLTAFEGDKAATFSGCVKRGGKLSERGEKVIEAALSRVRNRISSQRSVALQTAMLMNIDKLVVAEALKDSHIVGFRNVLKEEAQSSRSAEETALSPLKAVDRGRGAEAFFLPGGRELNSLGTLIVQEANEYGEDSGAVAADLNETLKIVLGMQEGDSPLSDPFVRQFLTREASKHGTLDHFMNSLDNVKAAYRAKTAIAEHLNTLLQGKSERVKSIMQRRGDWDLSRLIYKDAVAAESSHRQVDIEQTKRRTETIVAICERADKFVDEMAAACGVEFTEAERMQLVDSYLDRDKSLVNNYRVTGQGDENALQEEHLKLVGKMKGLVEYMKTQPEAEGLDDKSLNGVLISCIALGAKQHHVKTALGALQALKKSGAPSFTQGPKTLEGVGQFLASINDKISAAWKLGIQTYVTSHPNTTDAYGPDDYNTMGNMILSAHFAAHPEDKAGILKIFNENHNAWMDFEMKAGAVGRDPNQGYCKESALFPLYQTIRTFQSF